VLQQQRGKTRLLVDEGLRLHRQTGTRQAQADGAGRQLWHAATRLRASLLQRLQNMPPGLLDALAERRRAGRSLAQQAAGAVSQAQPRAGAAAVHADQKADRAIRLMRLTRLTRRKNTCKTQHDDPIKRWEAGRRRTSPN
jgi:hypothetical protein